MFCDVEQTFIGGHRAARTVDHDTLTEIGSIDDGVIDIAARILGNDALVISA